MAVCFYWRGLGIRFGVEFSKGYGNIKMEQARNSLYNTYLWAGYSYNDACSTCPPVFTKGKEQAMKYRELLPNEIEAYNVGYKVGNRQIVITDIEWETENEHKIYRKGYMAGLMDYKRKVSNVDNVSKVSSVSNVEIATPTTSITSTTPIGISISNSIGNEEIGGVGERETVRKKFTLQSKFYVNGQDFDEFPVETLPLLKKHWSDDELERIRKDLACKPYHETSVEQLLAQYPSLQKQAEEHFERFWSSYTPVKTTDGRVVSKGSRKETEIKYMKLIKSGVNPDDILNGLRAYINDCQQNNRLTCGATVFLNQERWKDDYKPITATAQQKRKPNINLDACEDNFLDDTPYWLKNKKD